MNINRLPLHFVAPTALTIVLAAVGAFAATPIGTTFTYQGRLSHSGNPVNGDADFQMSLFTGPSPGSSSQIGTTRSSTVAVADGTFTVELNFGTGAFNGDERWLEIAVRFPTGIGSFTTLTPRQRLNASPYALALPGLFTQPNAESPNIIGGFNGNTVTPTVFGATISGGGEMDSVNSVLSNWGTVGGGHGNNAGFECTVAGGHSNVANGNNSTISGGHQNSADNFSPTIGGGVLNLANGNYSTVGGGISNTVTGTGSTVAGGNGNTANNGSSTVGGGQVNIAGASFSTVSGGFDNEAAGSNAFVGGGSANLASASRATICGGDSNDVTSTGSNSFIGAGFDNIVSGGNSVVAGGFVNSASGNASTVGGGSTNVASGTGATVPGGVGNVASGSHSFAAGRRAKADFNGSFVWGDSTNADIGSGGTNTFNVRASGGTAFYSNSASTVGVLLAPGGGSWSGFSDRASKSNIQPVDPRIVLQKVVQLPISTWNYNAQDESIRHIGPMAQDFHGAFGVGEDDKHITVIDADGVALAAIQGLHQVILEKDDRINLQQREISDLNARMSRLEARLEAISDTNAAKP